MDEQLGSTLSEIHTHPAGPCKVVRTFLAEMTDIAAARPGGSPFLGTQGVVTFILVS